MRRTEAGSTQHNVYKGEVMRKMPSKWNSWKENSCIFDTSVFCVSFALCFSIVFYFIFEFHFIRLIFLNWRESRVAMVWVWVSVREKVHMSWHRLRGTSRVLLGTKWRKCDEKRKSQMSDANSAGEIRIKFNSIHSFLYISHSPSDLHARCVFCWLRSVSHFIPLGGGWCRYWCCCFVWNVGRPWCNVIVNQKHRDERNFLALSLSSHFEIIKVFFILKEARALRTC